MPLPRNYANITNAKKPGLRVKYSIFFITWNSNQYVVDTSDPKFIKMEAAADKYFDKFMNNISEYITIKNDDTIDKIKTISTDGAFEIGAEQRRFHAHIYVRIDHYTNLQINIDKLRKETEAELGDGYINVVASSDTTRSMADYIHKHSVGTFPPK